MKVLITGGFGFIGSEFVRMSLDGELTGFLPTNICIFDKLTYAGDLSRLEGYLENPRLSYVIADINDSQLISEKISDSDIVIHFAAESHVDRSIEDSDAFIETNLMGTARISKVARLLKKRMVVISTDEVYGSILSGAADEKSLLVPSSPYSASKAGGDLMALAEAITHNAEILVTRCTNNYGKFQNVEKFVPLTINRLFHKKAVPVYGTGNQERDWISTRDHCRAIARVALDGTPGQIYNIGRDMQVKNIDLVNSIANIMNIDYPFIAHVQDRLAHDFRYAVNSEKIKNELSWEPIDNIETDMPDLIKHYIAIFENQRL